MDSFYCLPRRRACAFLCALSAMLCGTPGSAQTGQPVVSTKLTISGVFPGTATVIPPRENLAAHEVEVVSYPGDALAEGVQGTVRLKMVIGADGSVRESQALENGGDSRLLNASLDGFRRAGFSPGTVDGVPTEMPILVEVKFSIKGEEAAVSATRSVKNSAPEDGYEMDDFVPEAIGPMYDPGELRRLVKYPETARENGIEGQVVVSVQIDVTGEIRNVVVRSATAKIFESAAREAVENLTFTPGTENGKPVKMWATLTIKFELEDPEPDSTAVVPAKETSFGKREEAEEYGMDEYVPGAQAPEYDMRELRNLLEYPKQARDNSIEGEVTVSVQVGTDGRAIQAVVRNSSSPMFDKAALDAVKALTYTPGMQNGKPVKMWVTFGLVFELD